MKKAIMTICVLAGLVVAVSGCIGQETTTFSGKYVTFEYPKDWNISNHQTDPTGSPCEFVLLKNQEGEQVASLAVFGGNVSLEDVESDVSVDCLGISDEGDIGDVHYVEYYSDEPRLHFYVFEKDGRPFVVSCDLLSDDVAKQIIESLKVKK
ncbi:hypothetical protein [Methanothermobacter tenebrarum]|nr:hypothetical protein [Methanothermobacter tenebrarum]MBC7128989.1 hypothetical protein [Thermoplasmatales archaeon]